MKINTLRVSKLGCEEILLYQSTILNVSNLSDRSLVETGFSSEFFLSNQNCVSQSGISF